MMMTDLLEPGDLNGRIVDGHTHVQPVRVYYEDTDASGIVYHANYAKYIERGRTNFLRLLGIHHQDLMALEDPIAFAVVRLEMDFLLPARLDDTLEVHSRFFRVSGAKIHGLQTVKRGDVVLVRARLIAACLNLEGRARRLPKMVRDAMAGHLAPDEG